MNTKNIHEGHRERLKQRFFRDGLDKFEAHQVLELLLFYVIPRRDTNEIAHRLLQRFGTIPAVLEAPVRELEQVDGMGSSSALYLHLLFELIRRYNRDRTLPNPNEMFLDTPKLAMDFAESLFTGRHTESMFVLLLDYRKMLFDYREITGGTPSSVEVNSQMIAQYMYEKHASGVIIAHNHPISTAYPSDMDVALTESISRALHALKGGLYDHIIVGAWETRSWVQSAGFFPPLSAGTFTPYYR